MRWPGHDVARRRNGFSRTELLFVIGLLAVLVSVALPAREFLARWERLAMAKGDLRSIVLAISRYHAQTSGWPGLPGPRAVDRHYGPRQSNSEVMDVLRAVEGPGNPGQSLNTNRVVYLAVATSGPGLSGLNQRGEFIDPWGNAYHIVLDLDDDNVCEATNSIYGRVQGEGALAWSNGPDGRSDTEDDVRSWKWARNRDQFGGVPF